MARCISKKNSMLKWWEQPGFSLLELLIVVAVIGVLMSITLPAMNQARLQNEDLRCSRNLLEIGRGFELYGNDWFGCFPKISIALGLPLGEEIKPCWPTRIDPYLVNQATWYDGVWQCPKEPRPRSEFSVSVGYGMVEEKYDGKWVNRDHFSSPALSMLLGEGRPCWDIFTYRLIPNHLEGTRHQGRANLLFVDSHVQFQDADEINHIPKTSLPWDVDLDG
jgi:prepilin-type N-terminal cleavage/methylation domain-containing protein/prepilin-type processing-associated H-X9-DG protein